MNRSHTSSTLNLLAFRVQNTKQDTAGNCTKTVELTLLPDSSLLLELFDWPDASLSGTNAIPLLNIPGSKPTGPCLGPEIPGSEAELSEKYSVFTGALAELCDSEELVETLGMAVKIFGSS